MPTAIGTTNAITVPARRIATANQVVGGALPPVWMSPMVGAVSGVAVGWMPNLAGAIVAGRVESAAQSRRPSPGLL